MALLPGMRVACCLRSACSARAQRHNGVNLVVGDLRTGRAAYATNRGPEGAGRGPRELARGLHALSNATLDAAWPKARARRCAGACMGSVPCTSRRTALRPLKGRLCAAVLVPAPNFAGQMPGWRKPGSKRAGAPTHTQSSSKQGCPFCHEAILSRLLHAVCGQFWV